MKRYIIINALLFLGIAMSIACENCRKPHEEPKVLLQTSMGDIIIKLYNETPRHHLNFLKLVNEGTYDGVLFHRVIADFMIQTGDPDSRNASPGASLGTGDVGYTVFPEFYTPKHYHKKGALAAARQGDQINPRKESSGCQFYIVQGKVYTDAELDIMEQNLIRRAESDLFQKKTRRKQEEINRYSREGNQEKIDAIRNEIIEEIQKEIGDGAKYRFTEQQRKDYTTIGGTPHLDGEYTVFGEVVEGLDVVDKISKVRTGNMDRPVEDIKILKASVMK